MKILHLFSDWKWTGPAEPTVILCEALQRRGHEVTLAYRRSPYKDGDSIGRRILGKSFNATDQFRLRPCWKDHWAFALTDILRDLRSLSGFIDDKGLDLVNVHNSHDHIVGGIATRLSKKKPVVIRTDHKREALEPSWGNRLLISKLTDGIMTFSETARQKDLRELPIPSDRVRRVGLALQLERYNPAVSFRNMREAFGIGQQDVVIGLVARFQKYRKTEVFLRALARLVRESPRIKALLVGRSSQIRESVIEPTKRLGLEGHVVLAGYQTEDYVDTLATMDIFVFLVPGSDGTARALREAMAMRKPAVVSKIGILPELIEDGVTGYVVDTTPESLFSALKTLVTNEALRHRMGHKARERALREFRPERQSEEVEAFYQGIIGMGPRVPRACRCDGFKALFCF